ncbi:MAG: M23 family metallopeptidase [Lewinellaceae bacterium]|nr:M23 family metallopeptidase [Saprospiraceae bacterium]MCB9342015.1 M23 family metallopeptidase [Lewinellaceae bacterium]
MRLLISLPILFIFTYSFSQNKTPYLDHGGGGFEPEKTECLTPAERSAIEQMLAENVKQLKKSGVNLGAPGAENMVVSFDWPLQQTAALSWPSYYGISNFVDQDLTAGNLLDYNCGSRTYDGHFGTDIFTWPFPWYLYDNNYVEVIAAEPGTIIGKTDGNADNHCSCSGNWNAVYVQHADGSIAWYGHMKTNSLTSKTVGQTVVAGEYLGVVASSGCSTAPHLHFEVYKALPYNTGNLIDPYQGPCNSLNPQTWWVAQKPYNESTLNALLTHSAAPVLGCPGTNESTNFSDNFLPGNTVYTAAYYHDQLAGQVTTYRIRRPDNSIWQTWTASSSVDYAASYWWWSWTLPSGGPYGTWKFETVYQGITSDHSFIFGGPPACTSLSNPANGTYYVPVTTSLSWPAATGSPTGYRLNVGTSPGGTDILNNFDVGNVTTYNPPGDFPYNSSIYVKVTPYNGIGPAGSCTETNFFTEVCTPNLVVTGMPVPAGTYWSSGDLTSYDATVANSTLVRFHSNSGVLLSHNFEVFLGAVFEANIFVCP